MAKSMPKGTKSQKDMAKKTGTKPAMKKGKAKMGKPKLA